MSRRRFKKKLINSWVAKVPFHHEWQLRSIHSSLGSCKVCSIWFHGNACRIDHIYYNSFSCSLKIDRSRADFILRIHRDDYLNRICVFSSWGSRCLSRPSDGIATAGLTRLNSVWRHEGGNYFGRDTYYFRHEGGNYFQAVLLTMPGRGSTYLILCCR